MEIVRLLREELAAAHEKTQRAVELHRLIERGAKSSGKIPLDVLSELEAMDADLEERRARIEGYTAELEALLPDDYPPLKYRGGEWN